MIKDGIITIDEALNNADSANNLQQVINNAAADAPVADPTKSVAPGSSFSAFTMKMDGDH
jgi:Tfp pilus assembly ATPase PilU